jgi:hypothetical protein
MKEEDLPALNSGREGRVIDRPYQDYLEMNSHMDLDKINAARTSSMLRF